ncbi:MAG TPA: non-ribosomal peptide synthetase, partial [Pyrinomonadaceae bacterium]|nr:non-ribosomal peptide synthetase [Pyrinomonadaceae bacterium]
MSEPKLKRQLLDSRLKEQRDFWVEKLSVDIGPSGLTLDRDRPAGFLPDKGHVELSLRPESQQKLTSLTRNSPFLIYATLMAALKVCLYKYTGSTTIVVGSPALPGSDKDWPRQNVLAIVDEIDERESFREFLFKVRENLEQSFDRPDYQYERLLNDLNRKSQPDRCELFDVALELKDFTLELPDIKNDLTLKFATSGESVAGEIVYNSSLFERSSIERFVTHFINVTDAALKDLNTAVRDLALLTETEQRQVVTDLNPSSVPYPRDLCLQQIFETVAHNAPQKTALVCGNVSLTYAELNRRANQLAHYLRSRGVKPEVRVGVCLERSVDAIVALLGIVKAGGVYVPLEPSYSLDRMTSLLEDAQVSAVVTTEEFVQALPATLERITCLDGEAEVIGSHSEATPEVETSALNLACIMYTSGTPKGVGVTHRGVVRLVQETNYAQMAGEVMLQSTPLSFDASTFEIWGSLLNGGKLVLAGRGAQTPEVIASHGVTTMWLTAGLFHQLIDEGAAELRGVRQLLAGGDKLSARHVRKALTQLPETRLIDGYGPTETTTFACTETLSESSVVNERVLIGRPIANTTVCILDEQMRAVPVGARGEIYIGGDGLARGYVGRADQTAEQFVPDPYSTVGGERLFASGDIGRYRPDGRIEFLGRRDGQVRIRGFRVEPGEIETVLRQYSGVADAVVIARQSALGEETLIAYIVKEKNAGVADKQLQNYLEQRLPAHMMPSHFVTLEKFPLTPKGKVDRAALPAPGKAKASLDDEYVPPRTTVEKLLADIWCELLGVDEVGVHDNFFNLGGHSLIAIKVATRIREHFHQEIN